MKSRNIALLGSMVLAVGVIAQVRSNRNVVDANSHQNHRVSQAAYATRQLESERRMGLELLIHSMDAPIADLRQQVSATSGKDRDAAYANLIDALERQRSAMRELIVASSSPAR